jgi:hypothetical protein
MAVHDLPADSELHAGTPTRTPILAKRAAPVTEVGGSPPGSSPGEGNPLYKTYSPEVAGQVDPARRYTVFAVRSAQFAFTTYEAFVAALGAVWDAGMVPEPRPSALGRDLPTVAPALRGVDLDLTGLAREDVEPPPGRFDRR